MSYENWKNKAQGFQTVDVRHIQGSFFEGLKKRAEALKVGEGLHIIQTFEPHPLYAVMEGLGYEYHTEQRGEAEFHVWFCRVEKKEGDSSAPFKPLALKMVRSRASPGRISAARCARNSGRRTRRCRS